MGAEKKDFKLLERVKIKTERVRKKLETKEFHVCNSDSNQARKLEKEQGRNGIDVKK